MIDSERYEQTVIAQAMHDVESCHEVFERLRPEHFDRHLHRSIWEAILIAVRKGRLPEPVTLSDALANDEVFIAAGGIRYLADLLSRCVGPKAFLSHADAVADRAMRRSILGLAANIQEAALDVAEGTGDTVLAALERGAADIARDGSHRPTARPVGLTAVENLEAAMRGDFAGVSTGLDCLDHVTSGIRQTDVWFIAGRTSMGKSVMGLNLARGIAQQGRGVIMFSLEMDEREVQARLIADLSYQRDFHYEGGNVRYGEALRGKGAPEHRDRALRAARGLASLPLCVNDRGGLTIDDIRAQAQRQFRAWEKAGVPRGAILIDHIGLVKPVKKTENKAADTADTVNELKDLAKQLGAPVISLVQVNRQTENRPDKRPTISDLNWSGAIEQIADFICLLYREGYYLLRDPNADDADIAAKEFDLELLIHKNRAGPICTIHAFCDVASNVVRDRDEPVRAPA